jgi:tripartite-type tricarboxylate transporter receptor subunit TctC
MRSQFCSGRWRCVALIAFAAGLNASPAFADPVADFYKGKVVRILVGASAGGEFDVLGRLVARHIGRHIPGNPNVIGVNMPGAAGLLMTNHLFNNAEQDGTSIGVVNNNHPMLAAVGADGVRFKIGELHWLGSVAPVTDLIVVWHEKGIKSIEQARKTEIVVGSLGRGNLTYYFPAMMNDLVGTKFKIVTGYRGGAGINLAMERREVDARSSSWSSLKTTNAAWLRDRKIDFLVQAGARLNLPEMKSVPSFEALARNDDDLAVIALMMAASKLGRPFAAAPGTPSERVAALRRAFEQTMRDQAFLRDAAAASVEPAPVSGAELTAIVNRVQATPMAVTQRAKKYLD